MTKAAELAKMGEVLTNSQIGGRRNIIINGAMQVAQRGTVTSATDSTYGGPDRFQVSESGDTVFTMSQDSDTPSGEGFANSMKLDVTTADSSLAASDLASLIYNFEGQDLQQLKKGTSSAEKVTVSFFIKSTITGTYIVQIYDNDNNRQISKSYTVSSANTWEKKIITFDGDTTGAFDDDNAKSALIRWWFAAGSNFSSGSLATSWESFTAANAAVGQVNAVNSTDNNIFITGVQLEVGEQATPFEHRSFGEELDLCRRYFYMIVDSNQGYFGQGSHYNSSSFYWFCRYPRPMRAAPSIEVASGTNYYLIYRNGGADYVDDFFLHSANDESTQFGNTTDVSGTGGQIGQIYTTANSRLALDAEL